SLVRQLAFLAERLRSHPANDAVTSEVGRLRRLAVEASRDLQAARAVETWCHAAARKVWMGGSSEETADEPAIARSDASRTVGGAGRSA
ncbi:MAG TPA: hypothetical protein VHU80_07410, partial [Polyangiaceae bacterium]|nr:hypothetical protein [Polyangiaceae bacterium]